MKNNMNYNIALDIGVGSVGWCVTDCNSNILKRHGRNMWGSTIFNEAETAKERRTYRGSRRRIDRRKQRIKMLQSLILDDMELEFPNFFQQLRESSLKYEDKKISGNKYNLFSEYEFTDENYYNKFKTIYHLRKYLMNTDEKVDLRLVYLAIHHIIKYRGNFLYEGEFSNDTKEINERIDEIKQFLSEKYGINLEIKTGDLINLLSEKNVSKANKKENIIKYFYFEKDNKQVVVNIINSILGYTFDLTKIFDVEIEKNKICFSSDIDNEEEIINALQENVEIYESMKSIYSWYVLQDILHGRNYISEALIDKFDKYQNDLCILKKIYREFFNDEYKDMFRKEGKNNYVAYNGKKTSKCKPEEFFNMLKNKIKQLPDDCEEKQNILNEIEDNVFLRKINVTDNGAIPHQLHQMELEIILDKQSKYYKTISENKDKILKIFSFRIPYYVGPLSKTPKKWSWMIRKSDEKITPWNFEEIVDADTTAEKFIKRMTNKCTYLINEDVMPKQSLLYTKFCVLNELNNIKRNDKYIDRDTKNQIIEKLFKKKKKVTKNMLIDFFRKEGFEKNEITGLSDDNNFNSNMSSYNDLEKILGKIDENNYNMCEDLIYWITIFEEKSILKRKIKKEYPELKEEQISKLIKLRFTGWSRLSKKLIIGLKSNDGESIMEKLEKTSSNFMQIINNKEYGFGKQIEDLMPKVSKDIKYKDIEEIPTSPSNKRAIWKTVCIIKEITKIMKCSPKNIYIEFARNEEEKVMKDTRVKQLIKKYDEIKDLKNYDEKVYRELKSYQNDKELSEKMYLYIIQNGKCLYSGETLEIDNLSLYEVDHIVPQSYTKDDSIDNKALVKRKRNQDKKNNLTLEDSIIDARIEWWKSLLKNGLITQNKYFKLTRRKIFETDNDRIKFVKRQLVETRQITKYVTNILKNSNQNSEIFAIRAELTHGIRKKFDLYKNRNVNNYHHAHDAYILNIIGNIIDDKLSYKEEFKYSEYVKKYFEDKKSAEEKYWMMIGFISKYLDISKVKKVLEYKDCYITRVLEEGTGSFYNQTLYSPKDNPIIPLKENLDVQKYGGYSNENKAYCIIFEYINEKGIKEYQLIGIPIKIAYDIKNNRMTEEKYIRENILKNKKYTGLKIVRNKILKNQQYIDVNNEAMRLCSDKEIRVDKELILNKQMNQLVYLMNSEEEKLKDIEKQMLKEGYEYMFEYLLEKLKNEYKVFKSSYEKLIKQKDKFNSLIESDKKSTINGLINLMETGQGNLKAIGLSDREGRMSGKKFDTKKLKDMTFIDKSITGMYESRFKIV
ncbi:MAG: type II CRISPR RNA-guided endonuclease Cas9 [Clostridia bacterium]|nr:type II CRISPR RNA-guided endonuclease Cas9 [Clostridia bacterium]